MRSRFGDTTDLRQREPLAREATASYGSLRLLENFLRDLGFSARLLAKSPGFTAVAILTLAVGVGANTAVFSLINGLLLRPLPVPHAEQLVVLRIDEDGPEPNYAFCTPFFRGLEQRHDLFANVFAYNGDTFQVQGRSGNENIEGMLVSGQFFQALETPPLLGRYLTPQDDQPGGSPAGLAVVISEDFWNNWFNRDADVVGRKMVIANTPFTVVGVMPKRFIGADPTQRPMIFAPLSADPIMDAPQRPYLRRNSRVVDHGRCTAATRCNPGPNKCALCSQYPAPSCARLLTMRVTLRMQKRPISISSPSLDRVDMHTSAPCSVSHSWPCSPCAEESCCWDA